MNKQKFLLLGGKPVGSYDIAQYIKSKGVYCIVCDYLPLSQSPAKQIADECWDYSTADIDIIAERAKKEGVNAIFTGVHEFNLIQCCKVAEKLQLPFYATYDQIQTTSNKRTYKDIMKSFGIPLVPEYKVNTTESIPTDIMYPILLKPVDGCGAYGLQICYCEDDVKNRIQDCLKYSDSKQFIAEQYIQDKEEITTVYIIKDGAPYLASVADRIVENIGNSVIPLPVQYIWNSKYLDLYKQTTDEKMREVIRKMGLRNGMLFMQSIVKDDVIMPYDIGFRISGTQEHVILEEICGYNPLKLLTDYAITGVFGDDSLVEKINPKFNCSASQITFLVNPGKVIDFIGIDEVEKMPGVIRVIKNKEIGDVIPESAFGTLNQIALRVFIKAKTREDIINMTKEIRKNINIKMEDVK